VSRAGKRIIAGLENALAFARGDRSRARLTVVRVPARSNVEAAMAVVPFPKRSPRLRKSKINPTKRVCDAINELTDQVGQECAFHEIANLADKMRRSLMKMKKIKKQ
jgi:hypothetical protein